MLVLITVNGLAIIRIHITKRELDKTGQAMRGAKHLMSAKFLLQQQISRFESAHKRVIPLGSGKERSKPSRRKTWKAGLGKDR